jgi:hypothetical protein
MAVTVYPVIAEPPVAVDVSLVHETKAEDDSAVATTVAIVGLFGTV